MFKLITSVVACIFVATLFGEGEGLTCYHCYEFFNDTLSLRSVENVVYGYRFVPCDKNMNNWDTWQCPAGYSVCVILSGGVKGETEIVRTCEKKDVCKTFRPPPGVRVDSCRECDTSLCNDFLGLPVPSTPTPTPAPAPTPAPTPSPSPPVKPNFLFNFNINIKLSTKKNPRIDNEYLK